MAVRRGPHIIKLHDSNPPLLGPAPGAAPAAIPAPLRDEGLLASTRALPPQAPPLRTPPSPSSLVWAISVTASRARAEREGEVRALADQAAHIDRLQVRTLVNRL